MTTNSTTIDATALGSATSDTTKPAAANSKPGALASSTQSVFNTGELFTWQTIESLTFAFRIGLTLTVLLFCLSKLNAPDSGKDNSTAYWGAITGLIAWWMPSPGNGKSTAKPDAK